MKRIICLIAFTGFGCCLFAQKTDTMMHPNMAMGKMDKMKDCVYMNDNHMMMMMKDGKTMMMTEDMKMKNGTTVMKDGAMMMKDGSKKMLMNGECVDMNGMMRKMKMSGMKMMKDSM